MNKTNKIILFTLFAVVLSYLITFLLLTQTRVNMGAIPILLYVSFLGLFVGLFLVLFKIKVLFGWITLLTGVINILILLIFLHFYGDMFA